MNLRNSIYITFVLLVSGVLGSCNEEFLTPTPNASIEQGEVFEELATAEAALTGAYDQLSSYVFDGMWVPLMCDIMGEDVMVNSENNWGWFVPVYQLNILPNYTYNDYPWWTAYKVIYDANKIIEGVENIEDATTEEKNRLEGEAKAIRAYTMLKLVQMYAPSYSMDKSAPGIMNVTKPVPVEVTGFARSSVETVYQQIVGDLLSAIDLLELNEDNPGLFNQRSAQALLARTYLDMEMWTEARDMAVAAHTDIELMSLQDLMYGGFNYRNSETLFTIAYTQEDNNIYMSIPSFYWPVAGYSSIRANDKFVESFETMDARRTAHFLSYPDIDPDRMLILKFQHREGQVGFAERIAIRASEMVLIEAECEAQLGNNTEARDALYAIQSRANPGAVKSPLSGDDLVQEILMERRRELFGEGFRLNDIKRRQDRLTRAGDHWAKFDFGPEDEDYYRLTFPIPQSEIDVNDQISNEDQNPGY